VEAGLIPKKDSVEEDAAEAAMGRARVAGALIVSRIVVVMTCVLMSKEVTVSVTVTATVGHSDTVPVPGGSVEFRDALGVNDGKLGMVRGIVMFAELLGIVTDTTVPDETVKLPPVGGMTTVSVTGGAEVMLLDGPGMLTDGRGVLVNAGVETLALPLDDGMGKGERGESEFVPVEPLDTGAVGNTNVEFAGGVIDALIILEFVDGVTDALTMLEFVDGVIDALTLDDDGIGKGERGASELVPIDLDDVMLAL
jgi:hypothetical protein